MTFTGSIIAWGKLSERIDSRPRLFPGQQLLNLIVLFGALGSGLVFAANPADGRMLFVVIVAAAFALGATAVAAEEIVVATDTAFVPFEFKQDGVYTGFDIEMWNAIADELDLKFELRPMDFSGIIPALQTGQVDVALAGITIKPERQEVIDFSDGYYDSGFRMMVSADSGITIEPEYGVTITDTTGAVITQASGGAVGMKGSRKSTPYAAQLAAESAARQAQDHGMKKVDVFVKGAGSGRETAIRSLQAAGLEIGAIHDVTPQAHNGVRPPKPRRN